MLHEAQTSQKVMIVGGGMVGFYLANRLEKMGLDVKLIEQNAERCAEIADKLSGYHDSQWRRFGLGTSCRRKGLARWMWSLQ